MFQVNYVASLSHQTSISSLQQFLLSARLKDDTHQTLIPHCIIFQHHLFINQLLHLLNVYHAHSFDVYRSILPLTQSYLLVILVMTMRIYFSQLLHLREVNILRNEPDTLQLSISFFCLQFIQSIHIFYVSFILNFLALRKRRRYQSSHSGLSSPLL